MLLVVLQLSLMGLHATHSARILIWHGAATIVAVPNPLDFYRAHLCSCFFHDIPVFQDSF